MQKILFNDNYDLTKAVLNGKKTQTRRIIPESWLEGLEEFQEEYFNDTLDHIEGKDLLEQYFLIEQKKKPHFAVGETLAVAQSYETIYRGMENRPAEDFYYPTIHIKNIDSLVKTARSTKVADILKLQDHSEIILDKAKKSEKVTAKTHPELFLKVIKPFALQNFIQAFDDNPGWKNKMFVKAEFMPYRIRITDIRLEHLQDISNDDCLKEGIKKSWWMGASGKPLYGFGNDDRYTSPQEAYAALIDKISGKGTWEKNPWVFVYDFEFVK